ncbi:hypothetical protein FOL46_008907 [Perkinsus olseni]|uniref:Uncharacterized protein n=1 Tax=Perkinsus olseni TaxID=32597 RepID=A0A7J6L4L0_PEROL|nr:hypothetical protein FOL46_008907 [Perkinsus olseni]
MPVANNVEEKVKALAKDLLGENPITEDALNTLVSNLVNNDLTTIDFLAQAPVALVDAVLNAYNGEAAKASARLRLDVIIEEAQARRSLKRKRAEKEVEVFNMATGLKNLQDHVGPLALKAPPELIPQSRFLNKLKEDPYTYVPMPDLQVAQDVVDSSVTTKENLETADPGSVDSALLVSAQVGVLNRDRDSKSEGYSLEFKESGDVWLAIPDDKIEKMSSSISHMLQQQQCSLKELESISGKLNWVCNLIPHMRVYLSSLYGAIAIMNRRKMRFLKIGKTLRGDCSLWLKVLQDKTVYNKLVVEA